PLGAPAPRIRRAGEPPQRPLGCRHEPGLDPQLDLRPQGSRCDVPHASVGRLHLAAALRRRPRADRQSEPLPLASQVGAERAHAGPRGPVLGPRGGAERDIARVHPCKVAVRCAYPQPGVGAPLEHLEGLTVQRLAHAIGVHPRLAHQRRRGRRDHCRLLVAHRGIGEQPDVGGQAPAGGDATQGGECVAARGAARERAALHCYLEHTHPPAGDPRACNATRSSRACVATTASVVLWPAPPRAKGAPPWARYPRASTNRPSAPRAPASSRPFASSTFPTALRTTSAPTTTSPARAAQVPTPPFIAPRGPSALPTVAPVPAPTDPSGISVAAAAQAR